MDFVISKNSTKNEYLNKQYVSICPNIGFFDRNLHKSLLLATGNKTRTLYHHSLCPLLANYVDFVIHSSRRTTTWNQISLETLRNSFFRTSKVATQIFSSQHFIILISFTSSLLSSPLVLVQSAGKQNQNLCTKTQN